jgi:hypothetical protein
MPAANLGEENPLPPLFPGRKAPQFDYDSYTPQEMIENMAYGYVPSVLPYSIQDGYTRELKPAEFRVAVLENDILRATFLLEFGGRLWSLFHKPTNRELLEVNPVFQIANLAIRNAWFSGGVEWNIGTLGHSPFTCSPLFAGCLERDDGTPILRLYEWERFRRVPFQIDACLPDGSSVLFLRVRIQNPNPYEVPMYWWTNIAVPENPDVRVITPADSAYCLGCKPGWVTNIPIPFHNGMDYTYSGNVTHAGDFFFDIPDDRRPWIAALDGEGRGLVHVSTNEMIGRKLWVWGKGTGGKNWQKFLSPPGQGYIEIQAGLTRTQLEHLPMPPGADWSWMEAYGMIEADPNKVHGLDWDAAKRSVDTSLEQLISHAELVNELEHSSRIVDIPPLELLQRGSGWGALERHRREASGEPPLCSGGLIFDDDSLGFEQMPWIELLEAGRMSAPSSDQAVIGFMVEKEWREMLEKAVSIQAGDNWFAHLHLGVMRYYARDFKGARNSWECSNQHNRTPWALRNLAITFWKEGKLDEAAELLMEACRLTPSSTPLVVECGCCLIEADQSRRWLEFLPTLAESVCATGRIRLLEAQAALAEGGLTTVEKFFDDEVIMDDLREGENTLSDLWFAYHERRLSDAENLPIDDDLQEKVRIQYPLPESMDFRMT